MNRSLCRDTHTAISLLVDPHKLIWQDWPWTLTPTAWYTNTNTQLQIQIHKYNDTASDMDTTSTSHNWPGTIWENILLCARTLPKSTQDANKAWWRASSIWPLAILKTTPACPWLGPDQPVEAKTCLGFQRWGWDPLPTPAMSSDSKSDPSVQKIQFPRSSKSKLGQNGRFTRSHSQLGNPYSCISHFHYWRRFK